MYANVALDSLPAREGGNSRQPTLPSRENFAATSVAVCQLPRANHVGGGSERVDGGCIPGFAAYTTIITDVFVIPEFRGRL